VRGKGPTIHMALLDYLDSEELHAWMAKYNEEILALVHVHQPVQGPVLLPVYILDQGSTALPVLLDGDRQAVAFPGMVLAVHTHDHQVETEFSCNGEEVYEDESTLTRAVLAGALQAGETLAAIRPALLACRLVASDMRHPGAAFATGCDCGRASPVSSAAGGVVAL
jgi:hypothetical protein